MHTTPVRMALRHAAVYAVVMGTALAAVSWTTHRYIEGGLERDLQNELARLVRTHQEGGVASLIALISKREYDDPQSGRFSLLVSPAHQKLAGNLLFWPREEPIPLDGAVHNAWIEDNAVPIKVDDDEVYWPVIATTLADGHGLLLARSIQQAKQLHDLSEYLVEVLSVAMALAFVMSVMLGRALLRRMETIGRAAGEIMAGDLSRRVPVSPHNDEFDALAARLNVMLDRIQQLIHGMREVTDNVAHDLRSPLARLRGRFEITLLESRDPAEYRLTLRQGIEEVEALIATFNALLSVAHAEAGYLRTHMEPLSLSGLACDLVELYLPLAEEKHQRLELFDAPGVMIHGNRDLLAQALSNVIENAIKYTPEGGSIRLQIDIDTGAATIVIADTGPGIPAAERAHVLERFVRLDSSRNTPGNGLGLALVRAVARVHGAELTLSDDAALDAPNQGLVVRLRFPGRFSAAATKSALP